MNKPFLSVIIPCRNEEKFIAKCLDGLLAQDYPQDRLEIIVVDGMSGDRTRETVKRYREKFPFVKLLENEKRVTPSAMNIGIREAKGDAITMVNAHSILDREFLKYSAEYLEENSDADAVGGALKTINDEKNLIAQAIPLAADSLFGTGGNRYRTRVKEGFIDDTLPYCLYRKEVFKKIGYIDEELIRDQDEEFNYRLLKNGGKIFFSPKIKSFLHIRPSIRKLWRQHFQYGYWKVKVCQKVGIDFVQKQIVPALFVAGLGGSFILSFFWKPFFWLFGAVGGSYLAVNLLFSLFLAKKCGYKYFFVLPVVFFVLHVSYGSGFLKGMVDFILLDKKGIKDVSLTR
ncbi:MAG TPA: glycosyltransferase family 2 protein [Candidatus Paceibacterota bacterium]|nr:glycosyltransferase family 2 protein [Candidatus Pacearchaeota archaeon]HRZ50672.1 glycosyltransferase family 2 protein [Candidatus Paceibacterota bacterium]HSA36431.1 glycosyltransferase family 2 protein [Candidatus Paceibacterota bacterium]